MTQVWLSNGRPTLLCIVISCLRRPPWLNASRWLNAGLWSDAINYFLVLLVYPGVFCDNSDDQVLFTHGPLRCWRRDVSSEEDLKCCTASNSARLCLLSHCFNSMLLISWRVIPLDARMLQAVRIASWDVPRGVRGWLQGYARWNATLTGNSTDNMQNRSCILDGASGFCNSAWFLLVRSVFEALLYCARILMSMMSFDWLALPALHLNVLN